MSKARIWNGCRVEIVEGEIKPFNKEVRLFRSKRRWWLYYAPDHCTGEFPSMRAAKSWWNNGGR